MSFNVLIHYARIFKLSPQMRIQEDEVIHLTPAHLRTFTKIFESLNQLKSPKLTSEVFSKFEEFIDHCDTTTPKNRQLLWDLSRIILSNFSYQSMSWIQTIYKRVMDSDALPVSGVENVRRYACLDLTKAKPETFNPESQLKVAQALVSSLHRHIMIGL